MPTTVKVRCWQVLQLLVTVLAACAGQRGGYSFSSFSGPVSGAVRAVTVARGTQHHPAQHHPTQHHPAQHHPTQHHPTQHHPAQHHPALHPAATVDYVAKPDYSFAYGVDDPLTGNSQQHQESRDGDVVTGEYTVLEADGSVRRVTYTADPKNGFQAKVHQTARGQASRPQAPGHQNYYDY